MLSLRLCETQMDTALIVRLVTNDTFVSVPNTGVGTTVSCVMGCVKPATMGRMCRTCAWDCRAVYANS